MLPSSSVQYDTSTRLTGLLGWPLGHSVSSSVQNALYQMAGINAVYLPMEIEDTPGGLQNFFAAFKTLGMAGLGVTMPYKTKVLPFLDSASQAASAFNCVNCVAVREGKLHGEAFDGYAMCQSAEAAGHPLAGKHVLVLGAGGVTGIVLHELAQRGVASITVLNRTPERAKALADILAGQAATPVQVGPLTAEALDAAAERCTAVFQCTSLGMFGTKAQHPYLGFVQRLPAGSIVVDAIYNPPQTGILKEAAAHGHTAINGMGMMAYNMVAQTKLQFGVDLGIAGYHEAMATAMHAMQQRAAK